MPNCDNTIYYTQLNDRSSARGDYNRNQSSELRVARRWSRDQIYHAAFARRVAIQKAAMLPVACAGMENAIFPRPYHRMRHMRHILPFIHTRVYSESERRAFSVCTSRYTHIK